MKEPVVIRQISGNKRKRAKKQAMLLDMKSSHNMFSHVFSCFLCALQERAVRSSGLAFLLARVLWAKDHNRNSLRPAARRNP